MSATSAVPAAVPSVTHSSLPCVPSLAENSAVPLPRAVNPGADRGAIAARLRVDVRDERGAAGDRHSVPCTPSSPATTGVCCSTRRVGTGWNTVFPKPALPAHRSSQAARASAPAEAENTAVPVPVAVTLLRGRVPTRN